MVVVVVVVEVVVVDVVVVVVVVVVEVVVVVDAAVVVSASVTACVTEIISDASDDLVPLSSVHPKKVHISMISIMLAVFFILHVAFLNNFHIELYHEFTYMSNYCPEPFLRPTA